MDKEKCTNCGACREACPRKLIVEVPYSKKVFVNCSNKDKGPAVIKVCANSCIGCGLCTTKCAFDAIHLHREHPECSTMVKYEKKIPSLAKYALKREIKIRFGGKGSK